MKKTIFAILLSLILPMCVFPAGAKTRRAMVIGLGTQLDKSWCKINGDRDVPLVVDMLRANAFTDISTLVNTQATKAGIVNAFNSLIARSQAGDIIYIHFSGHGQKMTDLNGDEGDGYDEAWIPYDAFLKYCDKDTGDKHLCDDEIAGFLTRLRAKVGKNGEIAVVVDACHSGSSTREVEETRDIVVRGADVDFIIPGKRMKTAKSVNADWQTLSACMHYQLNQEYNGYGKLTHILANNRKSFKGKSDKAILGMIDNLYESRQYKGRVAQNPGLMNQTGKALSKIFIGK